MGFAESSLIISTLMIFFVGLYHASNSPNFSIPQLIIIVIMSYSSFGPVLALIPLGGHLSNTIAAANRIFCLLDEVPSVKDPSEEELVDISIRNPGEIKLNSINFRYHGGQEELLSNVSLDIQTGSKIALIGPSGCGKSTLLRLIMRYWDVDSGNIKMDEVNIRNYLLQNLRSNIAIFSQNTYLFNTTIKENIRIGKYNVSEDEIILAAKQANIHNFILSLPNGYDSKVGELGGKISSGEKQRIGMARTLIQKREVIFLDEPTSNLDFLNEKALLKTINETFSKNTILIVSHRPSTIKDSDEVWMLKNKNIIVNTDKFNDWSRIPRAACKDL
jgi:ATP-binding cassette subfamily C protein